MRRAGLQITLFMAVALGGCATISQGPTDYRDRKALQIADAPFLSAEVRANALSKSDDKRGGLTSQQYRDTVVWRRVEIIDANYYDFEAKLNGAYSGLSVGSDLAVLALNGLGATTGAAAAKSAFAAASAGVIGAKGAISTDIFYQKALPSLIAQMRASRESILLKIETGLSAAVDRYPLDQALNDVNLYYEAGTLPSAITQVTAQASASLNAAAAAIDALRSSKYAPATTNGQKIVAWLYPNADETKPPDTVKLGKLSTWMGQYAADARLSGVPYFLFLHVNDAQFEVDRAQAVKDLDIP